MPAASEWTFHGEAITEAISGAASPVDAIAPDLAARVYHLYLPIYFFTREAAARHRKQEPGSAICIGLSAPQGCGKTTLVDLLTARFAADGFACAAVSIDDFYLTGAEQDAVASGHAANPLLQVRGNAGTHDLPLGAQTLRNLQSRVSDAEALKLPRYDKAQRGGRGDRAPASAWPQLPEPADVVVLEGWMAGFAPVEPGHPALAKHCGLEEINAKLAAYESAWHALMDAWVVLGMEDPKVVYTWRLQAEHAMKEAGRPGMTDAQVADFVTRYMPAYEAYLPGLYAAAEGSGVGGSPTFLAWVDEGRNAAQVQAAPR